MSEKYYKQKYLKYKQKYLELQEQLGGSFLDRLPIIGPMRQAEKKKQ